uniref:DUF6534 domain-containing protein n=1 Tax=Mycena chlorophos TaxID=658473 RepID=A0ABQ0LFM3_MYCCL|nr:predicted protein [Mycena chlorophos]
MWAHLAEAARGALRKHTHRDADSTSTAIAQHSKARARRAHRAEFTHIGCRMDLSGTPKIVSSYRSTVRMPYSGGVQQDLRETLQAGAVDEPEWGRAPAHHPSTGRTHSAPARRRHALRLLQARLHGKNDKNVDRGHPNGEIKHRRPVPRLPTRITSPRCADGALSASSFPLLFFVVGPDKPASRVSSFGHTRPSPTLISRPMAPVSFITLPPGVPPLDTTVGVWLVCTFVACVLQGAGMLQAFLYFVWYPKDPWITKATVITLVILQCIQMSSAIANVWVWFIEGFGDFNSLDTIHVEDMLQLVALFASVWVAQLHFARTIYQLMKGNLIIPILIVIVACASLGSGIGQVVKAVHLGRYHLLGATSTTSNLQAGFALAGDVLITGALCWRLNEGKSGGMQSTNRVLNFLILTAVNRGVSTMIFAVINIALFVSQPGTMFFMIGILISDKLYMNSLLAILNTRDYASHLRGGMELGGASANSMHVHHTKNRPQLGSFVAAPNAERQMGMGGISVVSVREDFMDMHDMSPTKRNVDF